jgi:glycosyltransferase involved in cell wall biosynthesis
MERVVALFTSELPEEIDWKVVALPHSAFTPLALLKNGLYARKHRSQVNHISGESHYLTFFLPRKQTILTIHDSLILGHLKGLKRFIIRWFFFVLPVHWVGSVTTISEASKDDLKHWAKSAMGHAQIVHDPLTYEKQAAPEAFVRKEQPPVFMTIGTKFNKNIERCIEAVAELPCRLLLIGHLSLEQQNLLVRHAVDYENRYDLSEEELHQAYRDSDALLFPSLGEGFGMPILEAQAFGRPVITSNCSSMPEVAGDGAIFVDPYSVASIRAGVLNCINDSSALSLLIDKGYLNLERFRPVRIAKQYADVYRAINTDSLTV